MSVQKKSPRSVKGFVFALFLLLALGGTAFWVMQETLDKGAPSLPGFAGNATGVAAPPSKVPESGGANTAASRGVSPIPIPQSTPQEAQSPAVGQQFFPVVRPPAAPAGTVPATPRAPIAVPGQDLASEGVTPDTSGTGQSLPFIAGGGDDITRPVSRAALPKTMEDAVVRLAFVDDLAAFLAENYWPRGTHPSAGKGGITTVSVKWANLRYGGELQGMRRGGDLAEARASVLRYVLQPSMLEGLYGLYMDRFMAGLAVAADARKVGQPGRERSLTAAEKKEILQIYAARSRGLGAAIAAYVADAGMRGRVESFHAAENAALEASRAYMESAGIYENAQEEGKPSGLEAIRARMERDAGIYQRSIQTREGAREDLVRAMKGGAARTLGDDTLVFVASWLYRRVQGNPEALRAAANVLQNAGNRLAAAAAAKE